MNISNYYIINYYIIKKKYQCDIAMNISNY